MNMHFVLPMLRRATLTLALCSVTAAVHAGNIDILPGGGDAIVAMLQGHSETFANAYLKMIKKEGLSTEGKILGRLRGTMSGATIARMEYTFKKGDKTYTRTYYGRSGPAMKVIYDRHTFSRAANAGTPDVSTGETSGSDSGSRPYEPTPEDLARDLAEEVYYPNDPDLVRAPNLPQEGSVVQASEVTGIHRADAELKVFRKIEADITSGEVTKGGKLFGYVSKALCNSCELASTTFADEFDIDGKIFALVEPMDDIVPTDPVLAKSNQSSKALKRVRKEFATQHFSRKAQTTNVEQEDIAGRLDAIEREETGEALQEGLCSNGT